MHEHPDIVDLIPPGTYLETIAHPNGDASKTMELAIFKEHRFAFYLWSRWMQDFDGLPQPPALVTIDWHRDLAPPSDSERNALDRLDLSDGEQVARFIWSGLDPHNDSHLLSAAYLNLIGDVFLLKNYGEEQEISYIDCFENVHNIFEYTSYKNFENSVTARENTSLFLDIDLDFFIKGKVVSHQLKEITPYNNDEIAEIIDNSSPLFKHLYSCLEGITIATEPRYCGGIIKSIHILEVVLERLFTPELQWKHL